MRGYENAIALCQNTAIHDGFRPYVGANEVCLTLQPLLANSYYTIM